MPIYITMMGGLGNQLFQIFNGLALAEEYNLPCRFLPMASGDTRPDYMDEGNMLDVKEIHRHRGSIAKDELTEDIRTADSPNRIVSVRELVWGKPINLKLYVPPIRYKEGELPLYSFIVTGYWNNADLFNKQFPANRIRTFLDMDRKVPVTKVLDGLKNPVAVHLRFGDYVKLHATHPVIPVNYYLTALKQIAKTTGDAVDVVLFFKESPEDRLRYSKYLEQITKAPCVRQVVQVKDLSAAKNERDELVLMSECKHHVIANSTFSWWGAFLRKHNSKKNLVYAPRTWFGPAWKGARNWYCVYEDEWEVI